jgi:hypothetical protein
MRSIYIFCGILLIGVVSSCKSDAVSQAEESPVHAEEQNGQPSDLSGSGVQGAAASPTSQGNDYTFLTHQLFHFKASFGGKKENGEPIYKDEWIDLDPNGNYKAGHLKKQTHTGVWTYNHATKILFLKPKVIGFKMSEWKVMYNEQMMVWVGTSTYDDNAIQVQLIRSDVLP